MAKRNLARDGAAKRLCPITVHGAAYHMRNGQLIAGISKTQAAHPVDDEPMIHQPTVGKRLARIAPVVGHRSRRNDSLC